MAKSGTKAKLKSLNELWGTDDSVDLDGKVIVQDLPIADLVSFVGHPFSLYEGERFDDMVESIKANGVIVPIIVRKRDANESEASEGLSSVFEILAGHNRREAALRAGKDTIPSVVLEDVSDEDALAIVVETNLLQRSFADMKHSEKAAVIALHHSKMFSQGKRSDILKSLELLEQGEAFPSFGEDALHFEEQTDEDGQVYHVPMLATKLHSAKLVGEAYGLSKNSVSRYLRVDKLVTELKEMMDTNEIGMLSAVSVSYLTEHEQILLADIMRDCGYSLSPKKAETLRQVSKDEGLNTISIKTILAGVKIPKAARRQVFKFKEEVFSRYFTEESTTDEVESVVEEALQYYFEVGPGNRDKTG